MKKLHTFDASEVINASNPPPKRCVYLYESVSWNEWTPAAPGYQVGGFPFPRRVRGQCLRIAPPDFVFAPQAGYLEAFGRNRYLQKSTASLLVMPPVKGDPCVNHLHIVPRTIQQEHSHPSDRIGLVVKGRGRAYYGPKRKAFDLMPGSAWILDANELHHFETGRHSLDVIVYHPDSEWGPTDDYHQMLQATVIPK